MNFRHILLLAFVASCALTVDYGFPEEEDVLVLTDSNFKEAIAKFEFILVEFYAPWCGHCKKLTPEFAKAGKELKGLDNPIPLAKVDATENSNIAKEFEVQGYPTLKFFVNGSPIEYNGGRTHPEIVNWIKKKTGPATTPLTSAEHVDELKKANKVLVTYFGPDNSDFEAFKSAAMSLDAVVFAHSHDPKVLEHYGG
jgi:protein disulfide-isomerase A1